MPAGVLLNDILLLFLETAAEAITVSGGTETWAEVTNSPQSTGTAAGASSTRLTVFWARASQNAPTSPATSDSGNHQLGSMVAVRGCITTGNPWDVTGGNVASTSTTLSLTGVTTTAANCLIVAGATSHGATTVSLESNASLSSLTEQVDTNTSDGNSGSLVIYTGGLAAAGASGTITATFAATSIQGFLTVALKPPSAGDSVGFIPIF